MCVLCALISKRELVTIAKYLKRQTNGQVYKNMNKFDEFIEENDQKLNVDTTTRIEITHTPSGGTSPREPTRQSSVRRSLVQPQVTPGRPSDQEHPLKDTYSRPPNSMKLNRSNTLKRKSLIQPIISPEATPGEHRQQQQRTRSMSNASYHSRTSSIGSEHASPAGKDLNALLQMLANKELELLDSKRKVDDIKRSLHQEEQTLHMKSKELNELKVQVAKILNDNVAASTGFNGNESHAGELGKLGEDFEHMAQKKASPAPAPSPTPAKKESMWTRPLSLFNQFDQLIQHEIEKKLNWDDLEAPRPNPTNKHSNENNSSQPNSKSTHDTATSTEDVLGNVSTSLWNFVSDVRTGLLGINEEPEETETFQKQPQKNSSSTRKSRSSENHLKFIASEDEGDPSLLPRENGQASHLDAEVELIDYKSNT